MEFAVQADSLPPSTGRLEVIDADANEAAQFIFDRAEGREVKSRELDIGFSIVERASA